MADPSLWLQSSTQWGSEAEREEAMGDAAPLPPVFAEQSAEAADAENVVRSSDACVVAAGTSIGLGHEEDVPDPASAFPASSELEHSRPGQDLPGGSVLQSELAELRDTCAQLLEALAAERADFDRELERKVLEVLAAERADFDRERELMVRERDACAAEAARWFEAAIAITADHNPLIERASRHRGRWWRSLARRIPGGIPGGIAGDRGPSISPITLGDRACAAGRWELAVRFYRDALELDPHEARLWFRCGYALRAAGEVSEADLAYRQGLEYCGHRLPLDVSREQVTLERRDA
jgi:tetratricopeptide (TPR) repeat protein